MRKVFRWLFILFLSGVALVTAAYFLAKKYEEPVRNYIVKEVNKRLQSELHVADINFSLLKRFPSASLVMDSVWAEENIAKIGEPDTLFFFAKAYLNLNIFDLIDGNYKINEIETSDGFMHLLVDEKGYDNFHIWVESQDTSGFFLELDKVHIQNTDFIYKNQLRRQLYHLNADDLYFRGRFSDDSYTMAIDGDGYVHDISIKETSYLKDRDVAVESDMDIISSADKYVFRKGRVLIDDALDFTLSGQFEGEQIDLKLAGSDLDIIKTLGLLPSESRSAFDEYASSGKMAFDATLKGVFGKTENPRVQANFKLDRASVKRKGSSIELEQLIGSGSIDNGEKRSASTTTLVFDNLVGQINGDPFSASVKVSNFTKPTIIGDADFKTDIAGLREFFDLQWLEEGSGTLALKAHIETTIQDPDTLLARDFLNAKASGQIAVSDARIKLKDDERVYAVESSEFTIQNNTLAINQYLGKINDCEIELSGKADNFLNYLFTKGSVLDVKGKIKTGAIDLEELFPTRADDSGESSVVVAFPQHATWDLEIIADAFKNGKFLAREISGHLQMDAFKAEANSLQFVSQEGNVQGSVGLFRFAENQFGMKTDFQASQINLKTLLETFNNFDQDYITSEVVEGVADADIQFLGFCDSLFNINTKSIVSSVDLTVKDGALVGFKPIIELADYVKQKPMLRLFVSADELRKRLENIQFATLTNEISIRNGMITIPQMEIRSSAVDLNVTGTHSFEDDIDYSFDFALSDLLTLKDRNEPYNEYVQRDNDGKTRMYLTMKGTVDDFEVDVVKTDFQRSVKSEMKDEKNQVKGILKQELGLFKGDSNVVVPKEEKPQTIGIEFDAEAGTQTSAKTSGQDQTQQKPKEEDKGLLNRFIKKTETDKKKLTEGDFDDDDF